MSKALVQLNLVVRWGDLDAYNHVNNATYLTYLEQARIAWFESFPGPWRSADAEPLVARIACNYRVAVTHPAVLRVGLHAERVGNTSLTLRHEIHNESGGLLHADGEAVLVWVDPRTGRPRALPEVVLAALKA